MSSLLDYGLRLVQYLDLMLLFGIPLLLCYGPALAMSNGGQRLLLPGRSLSLSLLFCTVLGLALASIGIVRNTAGIMGMAVAELTRDDLAWYAFDVAAGRANLVRVFLLLLLSALLGWQARRPARPFPLRRVTALAGMALLTLAWNGHAAAGEGLGATVRLVAGITHLLAAGGWVGALVAFVILLSRAGKSSRKSSIAVLWQSLHRFSLPGAIFVGILTISGGLHYGDLIDWSSAALLQGRYGKLLLIKLLLFAVMLGLAALHRWWLLPQFERDIHGGASDTDMSSRVVPQLRLSVSLETAIAVLILASVAVLGTLNPVS